MFITSADNRALFSFSHTLVFLVIALNLCLLILKLFPKLFASTWLWALASFSVSHFAFVSFFKNIRVGILSVLLCLFSETFTCTE